MKRSKKKLVSALLTMVMAIVMFVAVPRLAYAAFPPDLPPGSPPVYTASLDFVFATADDADVNGTWSWNNAGKVLTLNNINLITQDDFAISVPNGTTIILVGDNSLTSTNSANSSFADGIFAYGDLTITGDGSLVAASGAAQFSYGIQATGSLTINGGAQVTTTGNTATGSGFAISLGMYAYGSLTISEGSTVTAQGGDAGTFSAGIFAINSLSINDGTTVVATGGTVPNGDPAQNTGSYGIYVWRDGDVPTFAFSGSVLQAAGDTMAILSVEGQIFTVPAGYIYWVNNSPTFPGGSGTLSAGDSIIDLTDQENLFVRIELPAPPPPLPPPSPSPGPSDNLPQTGDMNIPFCMVTLALVLLGTCGLIAGYRRQGVRE